MTKKAKLTCRFFPINEINIAKLVEMHSIFTRFYENADLTTFIKDMSEKKGVMILKNKTTGKIVGFSTYNEVELMHQGKKAIGVFTGDTIVEPEFWGNKTLHTAFAMKMLKAKMLRPTTPMFWLLISKGYKTYLLMANNFQRFYPRHDHHDHEMEGLMQQYCQKLYPTYYKEEEKILDFGEGYHALKEDVADITPRMRASNSSIRFFEERNPEWRRGTELPCVGEIGLSTIGIFFKKLVRSTFGLRRPARKPRRLAA